MTRVKPAAYATTNNIVTTDPKGNFQKVDAYEVNPENATTTDCNANLTDDSKRAIKCVQNRKSYHTRSSSGGAGSQDKTKVKSATSNSINMKSTDVAQ